MFNMIPVSVEFEVLVGFLSIFGKPNFSKSESVSKSRPAIRIIREKGMEPFLSPSKPLPHRQWLFVLNA